MASDERLNLTDELARRDYQRKLEALPTALLLREWEAAVEDRDPLRAFMVNEERKRRGIRDAN